MADMILNNHHLLSMISRFDIKLGFGEKTIEEVCSSHKVNVDFFLEIVNTFNEPDYFPKNYLESFQLSLIITYLKNTHHYYLNLKMPEIYAMIQKLIDESKKPVSKELKLISKFFVDYKIHLGQHIKREEEIVYPYVLNLERYYKSPSDFGKSELNELKAYAIKRYVDEHENIEESLYDLKSLIIKYLPPQEDNILCYKILGQLGHLEKDINDHSNLENRVLVPRVSIMEKMLK